jgi:hypothetical protein
MGHAHVNRLLCLGVGFTVEAIRARMIRKHAERCQCYRKYR